MRWIEAAPTNWTTFVANRVAKIQLLSEGGHWRHVPGVDNPADLISRGILPENLINNNFWWNGPSWLMCGPEVWPQAGVFLNEIESDKEKRRTAVIVTVSQEHIFVNDYVAKFSSYSELMRRTAFVQRFIKRMRKTSTASSSGFITADELKAAEYTIIRLIQENVFQGELKSLLKEGVVSRTSPLRWFKPFICKDGLIRIGGRLQNSTATVDAKHPIVLPARHHFTRLLFECYHKKLLHAGVQHLLSVVRLRFWPLGGRNMAKQVVHQCLHCFRAKPAAVEQLMGDLPTSRVQVSRPFSKTGIDYFGPLYIRPAPRRVAVKAYGAIFICMATKAVHLELVSDLSTDRFMQALKRFIARRGKCSDIYSDNGTNFVGAKNHLKELWDMFKEGDSQQAIAKYCANESIRWHFNPPRAPHFGGLWEAAVRSAKFHLVRVIGENPLSSEDMRTLLVQIEGCLNSRPITSTSDDPEDLEPLTPAHFLVGSSLQSLPEVDYTITPTNRLNQWQQVQRKVQEFWKRWKREYLSQLQARTKRWKPAITIDIGKLAVICDDNQPPTRWKMGRIEAVHPGADGVVRVVSLRTAAGNVKRAVEKICLLPNAKQETEFFSCEKTNPT